MSKKILVFGSSGMLGDYFCNMLEQKGYEVIRNDKASGGIDITDEQQVRDLVFENNPEYVVNCAAFTNVDLAENEKELAFSVNAKAPEYMAKVCKELQTPFVHVSTDYIFGENKEDGYVEEYTNFKPLSIYGESKLEGELNVLKQEGQSYIFRTSWLFGPNGKNFVSKITELAKERPHLNVVTDEIGCPTYVRDLSEAMLLPIEQKIEPGIYHVCSSDHLSRNEFAKEVLRLQNLKTPIYDAKLDDFPREAKVPHFSVLLNTKLDEARTSSEMLEEYFKQG